MKGLEAKAVIASRHYGALKRFCRQYSGHFVILVKIRHSDDTISQFFINVIIYQMTEGVI